MASWFSCKPCNGSDPTQDTVKVDIRDVENLDKENVQPVQLAKKSDQPCDDIKEKKVAEERRKRAEEAKRKETEALAAQQLQEQLKKAAQKLAEEKARREAEEEEEARRAAAQKERLEAEAAAVAEAERRLLLEVERQRQLVAEEEAAQSAAELAAAQEKVGEWCKKNKFYDINTQKMTIRGATKFPLHTAVKHQDDEIVRLLLKCGADQHVKDSRKQTPGELAAAMNKNGSHNQIIALLHEASQ